MKQTYEQPEMTFVELSSVDVIAAGLSGMEEGANDGQFGGW